MQAVISNDAQLLDVIYGFAAHHRVHAAGVISDHAPQSAVVVRGRIRGKGQMIFLRGIAKIVKHHPGLHARALMLGIQLHNAAQIFRAINYDGDVATLSSKAGSSSAR